MQQVHKLLVELLTNMTVTFLQLTGFDTSFVFPFSVVGRNGIDLREKWKPYPKTYLSVCVDGFPNCFFSGGPNSCTGAGIYLGMLECQVDYAVKAAQKLQRERLKSIDAKPEAVEDFDEIVEVRTNSEHIAVC